jgi:hypothetical protein
MKKYLAALSTTALISVAPLALAASSTDLTVTGTITPSACTPSFSEGGTVDLGKISAKDLNPTNYTLISSVPMNFTVACTDQVLFALNGVDNNPGTAADNQSFGLGMTTANQKIGGFAPRIVAVDADGVEAGAIYSINAGTSWARATYMSPGRLTSLSAAGSLVPLAAENVVMNVLVDTWIARADSLTLTDDVKIDGSATFEMKYL